MEWMKNSVRIKKKLLFFYYGVDLFHFLLGLFVFCLHLCDSKKKTTKKESERKQVLFSLFSSS